ncbi:MAG: PKD domain-containing protein [Pirellulaceae bacterium]
MDFIIEVVDPSTVNQAPTIEADPSGPFAPTAGATLTFDVTAADADGTVQNLQALNAPSGMTLSSFSPGSSVTRTATWMPTQQQSGQTHVVTFQATDDLAATATTSVSITPQANQPPSADANGPYTIDEGDSVTLDASASSDPDGDSLSFTWDVNGDGTFGDATGETPTLSWSQLNVLGIDDDGTFDVSVRVDDGNGGTDTDTTTLDVENIAPTVSDLTITPEIDEGDFATLSGTISDPSPADSFTMEVDWGDGSAVETFTYAAGSTSFSETHQYLDDNPSATSSDVYQTTVNLADDDTPDGTQESANVITFNFQGHMTSTDEDFTDGDEFVGSFTFVSTTSSVSHPDSTLNLQYPSTMTDWRIAFPMKGYEFAGSNGTIAVGNDTSFGDRYIATMHSGASVGDSLPSGRTLNFSQIDLQDPVSAGADFLNDDSIQTSPPDLSLAFRKGGRILFSDNSDNHRSGLVLEQWGTGPSVTVNNVAPEITGLSVDSMIDENGTATLSGSYTDPGTLDEHDVAVNWDDPNNATDSTFAVDAIADLSVGHTFNSGSGDGAVLTVTGLTADTVSFSVQHQYLDDGPAPGNNTADDTSTIQVTVDDDDTGTDTADTEVTVHNVAPEISSLSLSEAEIDENETISVSGTFEDIGPLDEHDVVVDWDNPNDAADSTFALDAVQDLSAGDTFASSTDDAELTVDSVDLVTGTVGFTVAAHRYLDDGPAPGNGTSQDVSTIEVTVTDDDTGEDTDTADVTVKNVAPEITDIQSSSPGCGDAREGENDVTVSGDFSDVGTLDMHTAEIDWGDGNTTSASITESNGSGTYTGSHTYAEGGIYTVTVSLVDDDTGEVTETASAVITGAGVNNGTLYVIGTEGDDHVTINPAGNSGRNGNGGGQDNTPDLLRVHADFLPDRGGFRDFDAADVDKITLILCDGDDHATVASSIQTDVVMDGGAGNDQLEGGDGSNIIWGSEGDDRIVGGSVRDILIGGGGADRIVGNGGQDILLSGATIYHPDDSALSEDFDEALRSILDEWNTGDSVSDRMASIQAGDGLTGGSRLDSTTLLRDGQQDMLTGSAGIDWFLFEDDNENDRTTDLDAVDEIFTDLSGLPVL